MEDYKTRLKLLPVCNCGYVFRNGVTVYRKIVENNGLKHAEFAINPPMCPSCEKEIECIECYDWTIDDIKEGFYEVIYGRKV